MVVVVVVVVVVVDGVWDQIAQHRRKEEKNICTKRHLRANTITNVQSLRVCPFIPDDRQVCVEMTGSRHERMHNAKENTGNKLFWQAG